MCGLKASSCNTIPCVAFHFRLMILLSGAIFRPFSCGRSGTSDLYGAFRLGICNLRAIFEFASARPELLCLSYSLLLLCYRLRRITRFQLYIYGSFTVPSPIFSLFANLLCR